MQRGNSDSVMMTSEMPEINLGNVHMLPMVSSLGLKTGVYFFFFSAMVNAYLFPFSSFVAF